MRFSLNASEKRGKKTLRFFFRSFSSSHLLLLVRTIDFESLKMINVPVLKFIARNSNVLLSSTTKEIEEARLNELEKPNFCQRTTFYSVVKK